MLSPSDRDKIANASAAAHKLAEALRLLVSADDPLLSLLAQKELLLAVDIRAAVDLWDAVTAEPS